MNPEKTNVYQELERRLKERKKPHTQRSTVTSGHALRTWVMLLSMHAQQS